MLLTTSVGMVLESTGMLPLLLSVLLDLLGMLLASETDIPKNSASAALTPAENIVPFLDIKPFCLQKAMSACSTSGAS